MASVTGSRLAFFSPTNLQPVHVVLTANGTTDLNGNPLANDTVAGSLNVEVFTQSAGTLAAGYQASALIQGASPLGGAGVQAGSPTSTEALLDGSVGLIDKSGGENISVDGAVGGASDTIIGSQGDTITGSGLATDSQLIDASGVNAASGALLGPETIVGGAGPTTVWSGTGDSIMGGTGALSVSSAITPGSGIFGNDDTVVGSSGKLSVFDLGTGDSVVGGSGTTFIDDSYGAGNTNTLVGGSGTGPVTNPLGGSDSAAGGAGSWLVGGPRDMLLAGAGTMLAQAGAGDTVVGGTAAATVRGSINDSVVGGAGGMQYNEGSGSSVSGGAGNLNAWAFGSGNTIGGGSNAGATTFIDDSYTAPGGAFVGGSNTIGGGAGSSELVAGPGDTLVGGTGSLTAFFKSGLNATGAAGENVDLSGQGSSGATLVDLDTRSGPESLPGSTGTDVTVTGFNTATDTVASSGSVVPGGGTGSGALVPTAHASQSGTNAVITFADGSTMTLLNTTLANVHFIQ